MASETDVKNYIACWMQLGKKIWLQNGQSSCQVQRVIQQEIYSPEFEACWAQLCTDAPSSSYLDGTNITLQDLLSDTWEISDCARCNMPVALPIAGVTDTDCPCQSLNNWPNTEIPCPRPPVSNTNQLKNIQSRLGKHCS